MRFSFVIPFFLGAITGAVAVTVANRLTSGSDALKAELMVKPEFVADHPEILERVRTVLLNRRLAEEGAHRVQLMHGKWQFLTHVAFTPTIGNADSPRVLLEFTDYTCEPCRTSAPLVRKEVESRQDVRIAIFFLPIGGALAEYAARIAIAAYRQDPERFAALHTRLMEQGGDLTQERVLGAVRALKFDMDQVERDAQSDETRRYLQQVRACSEDLGLSGVPAFLFDDRLVIGGVAEKQLRRLLGPSSKDEAILVKKSS